jgi:F1F0 ATPase subunit 2
MLNETVRLLLAWVAGGILGALFFGGLHWTVNKGVSSPQPALWFCGSMLLRTGIALTGFYFVAGGHWERLLVSLLGFVMARLAVLWLTKPARNSRAFTGQGAARGATHAP